MTTIKTKTSWLLVVSAILVGTLIATFFIPQKNQVIEITATSQDNQPSSNQAVTTTTAESNSELSFIDSMVAQLKSHHSHEIQDLTVQLSMRDFKAFVLEQYPDNGAELFQQLMHLAFPDHAEQILELVNQMDVYEQWLAESLLDLQDMNELTRHGAIWMKRREMFGDLANIIWQHELNQEDAKQLAVNETINALHKAEDIAPQERLHILQNTIQEQYGDGHIGLLVNKGMVANMYFHLDSVQKDLHSMSPEDRANAIAESRRQLGFTEDDIEHMAKQDSKREARWQNGYAYMAERDQLTASYSGESLEEKLDGLREKFFGAEAPTIKKEEESGFNRYERPRLYGRN